nr:putative integron gene cassette protein [uncultured bacterium]CAP48976.1 putative integron gene cassette protein [uncultured bacterium]CAP49082.1 putative integron gene cassette protein [uncultured bacterium]
MEEQKPITQPLMLYLGVALGLPGVFFMTQGEAWLTVLETIFGEKLVGFRYLNILVDVVPILMFVVGLAFMLKARDKKKTAVAS